MKKAILVSCILSLSACGGGGGGSNNSPSTPQTPASVSLQKLNSTTVGTIYTAQLSGSDTDGVKYTGSISIANRDQKVVSGVLVTPKEILLTGNVVGGSSAPLTIFSTGNIDSSTGNLISQYNQATGVTCVSVSPYHMPDSVKAGDFGVSATLTCNDNTSIEGNWRVEGSGSNFIVIVNATLKNSSGTLSVAEVSYTLDSNGNIQALKEVITVPSNNYSLAFSSK